MSRLSAHVVPIAGTFADAAALAHGLTTSTGTMIAFFDREYRIGWANERFAEWFGLRPEALVGRALDEVYGVETVHDAMPRLQRVLAGGHERYERLLSKPGTTPKWISVSLHPHRDASGTVVGIFASSIEVDELRRTRDALDRSMQEIAIYLENSPLAVIERDRDGRIRRWAGQAERIFDWTGADVLGCSAAELGLVHPESTATDEAAMRELLDGHTLRTRSVSRNVTRSGRVILCEWFHSAFVDADGATQGVLSLAQDVTARVEAEEQLRHAAVHDALTGAHNRRYLLMRLEYAVERARRGGAPPAMLYLDLDHFKPVNDRHGHAVGDAVLVQVVRRLHVAVRADDCVARVGGDEFVVLLDSPGGDDTVEEVTSRILRALSRAFDVEGLRIAVGASIGTARYPADGASADALLRHADAIMFRAKRQR